MNTKTGTRQTLHVNLKGIAPEDDSMFPQSSQTSRQRLSADVEMPCQIRTGSGESVNVASAVEQIPISESV